MREARRSTGETDVSSPACAFSDGVNPLRTRHQIISHLDTSFLRASDTRDRCKIVSGLDSDRKDYEVRSDSLLADLESGEYVLSCRLVDSSDDVGRSALREDLDTHIFDLAQNEFSRWGVELAIEGVILTDEDRDGRDRRHVVHRFGSFESKELRMDDESARDPAASATTTYTSTNDGSVVHIVPLSVVHNLFEIREVSVHEDTPSLFGSRLRNVGRESTAGSGSEDENVVGEFVAL